MQQQAVEQLTQRMPTLRKESKAVALASQRLERELPQVMREEAMVDRVLAASLLSL